MLPTPPRLRLRVKPEPAEDGRAAERRNRERWDCRILRAQPRKQFQHRTAVGGEERLGGIRAFRPTEALDFTLVRVQGEPQADPVLDQATRPRAHARQQLRHELLRFAVEAQADVPGRVAVANEEPVAEPACGRARDELAQRAVEEVVLAVATAIELD